MLERFTLTAKARFNIARGQLVSVVTADGEAQMRWGILRPWRGHGGKRGPMIYTSAIADVDAMPVLRDARKGRKQRRCIVLADGFYAWAGKQPIWFHTDPVRVVGFAALANTNPDDDQPSVAILEDVASALVAQAEPMMPIVVGDHEAWLARGELVPDTSRWRGDRVSTWVNNAEHDDAKCIAPLGNPAQGELF